MIQTKGHTRPMIESPAFVSITIGNGSVVKGRAVRYTDPAELDKWGGMFSFEDSDGSVTYVLASSVAHITVFPLTATPPEEKTAE